MGYISDTSSMGNPIAPIMKKYGIELEIGQEVYLKTDPDQKQRIITGICIRKGNISYIMMCETMESWHYAFEITTERDVVKATSS